MPNMLQKRKSKEWRRKMNIVYILAYIVIALLAIEGIGEMK